MICQSYLEHMQYSRPFPTFHLHRPTSTNMRGEEKINANKIISFFYYWNLVNEQCPTFEVVTKNDILAKKSGQGLPANDETKNQSRVNLATSAAREANQCSNAFADL